MTLSMYQASVPVFVRGLENLSAILAKGAAHAEAKKIDPAVVVNARLGGLNDAGMLDLLLDWAPDEAVRRKILVDTPARLYGFA